MNSELKTLEPKALWNHFISLNAVPRPSKKEERVIAFMKAFGKSLGLATEIDSVGNVLIKKPATMGFEDRKTVVMQSHLDMVHQKNEGTPFNFEEQGIEMYIEGDWVKAKGTTLGADNGIGVATIMAILASKTIDHPAIEALFTIDEETGMTGAMKLSPDWLTGEILLNLDTEEDDEIGIGCAGGVDLTARLTYKEIPVAPQKIAYTIAITGLNGGHSGIEIHKGLGNANKLMNRLLYQGFQKFGLQISEVKGGSLRNAIPRESFAMIVLDEVKAATFEAIMQEWIEVLQKELEAIEPKLTVTLQRVAEVTHVMSPEVQQKVIQAIYAAHNGVYRMSPSIPDLVETSNNIAKVTIAKGEVCVESLTRSSVDSSKEDMIAALQATFELAGFEVDTSGDYPGWAPNPDSAILAVLDRLYQKMNGEKARIAACHAGLECGILGQHYPEMDMISFGPTIQGAHSPEERVSISSVQKYWNFVIEILKQIPYKPKFD